MVMAVMDVDFDAVLLDAICWIAIVLICLGVFVSCFGPKIIVWLAKRAIGSQTFFILETESLHFVGYSPSVSFSQIS